jgi:PAS domain S-box-containing protein
MAKNGSELFRWYIALLRRDAKLRAQQHQNMTPLTLVERDKSRLQDLIAQSGKARVERSAEILKELKQRNADRLGALRLMPGAGGIKRMFDENLVAASKMLAAVDGDTAENTEPSLDKLAELLVGELEQARHGERLIADYTPDLLCCLDENRLVLEVNLQFELVTGYQKLSIVAVPIDQFITVNELPSFQEYLAQKQAGIDGLDRIECGLRRPDGAIVDLEWHSEWSQTARCFFSRARDISERKQRERLRDQVTSMARHDLRGPLTGIGLVLDNVELGVYGTMSESGVQAVEEARKSIERMVEMVDELISSMRPQPDNPDL